MRPVRAVARLLALLLTNVLFFVYLTVTGLLVAIFAKLTGKTYAASQWRTRVFRVWCRAIVRLLGMRVEVQGNPPQPPFVLVSNHLGYIDVIALASELRCVFVSRADVRDWPGVGHLCRSVDTLFIQREDKRDIPRVMNEMEQVLASGRGIVLFPEGTSSSGDGVLPFRPSLLALAARSGRPVHFASISYRTPSGSPPARDVVCWWGEMPFASHLFNLAALPGFRVRLEFGHQPILESDRKILAERLQREVERQIRTVVWVRSPDRDRPRKES
jgi:1-acyl-sn-glycerol-3-phosphate acyltransferase